MQYRVLACCRAYTAVSNSRTAGYNYVASCIWFSMMCLLSQMQTLNLFELSQHFSQTGPHWLKETKHHPHTPLLTPAPPPSACGYYHAHLGGVATQQDESAVLMEDEDSELDYGEGGCGTTVGHRHKVEQGEQGEHLISYYLPIHVAIILPSAFGGAQSFVYVGGGSTKIRVLCVCGGAQR
jgi:hypothetical protein